MNVRRLTNEEIDAIVARREYITRCRPPVCQKCASDQIQLMAFQAPANWRCRKCKTRFTWEPS